MTPMIIRDIPMVRDLETKLIGCSPNRDLSADVEYFVDMVSMSLFGIKGSDTEFEEEEVNAPKNSWEYSEWEWRKDEHDAQYDSVHLTDDETAAYLLAYGLDFHDSRGQPLRCVMWLRRQAEAAAKGIMGTMPDPVEFAASKLEAEAAAFRARKGRSAA